jgi:transmembrane sensor
MMPNNRLWLLMSRRLSGEASPAELEELESLLEDLPGKQYLLEILNVYFDAHVDGTADSGFTDQDLEERFYRVIREEEDSPPFSVASASPASSSPAQALPEYGRRNIPFRKFIWAAATIAGILLLGWGTYHLLQRPAQPSVASQYTGNEVIARPGARTKLELPDGTQVWLNSGSKLNYQRDFNSRSREVVLEGEAFFDVVKDPSHPFIVHASSIDIKVLGTSFTVKSYPQDETIETTLLRGMIEVTRQDNPSTPRVILKPNEKLILSKHLALSSLPAPAIEPAGTTTSSRVPDISISAIAGNVPDSDKVETSWMYNKLVFEGDSFKELAQKMERWFNVKISFKDEGLNQYHFGGVFDNETVIEALNALQLTAKFTYKIKGNEIDLFAK